VTLNGQLMALYMQRYGIAHKDFAPFALVAHANAHTNPNAVFKNKSLTAEQYEASKIITPGCPIQVRVRMHMCVCVRSCLQTFFCECASEFAYMPKADTPFVRTKP